MPFWNKKKPVPQEADSPPNPFILIELVDEVNVEISIGWPLDDDVKMFSQVLKMLNSGKLIEPQLVEATLYAESVKQPEKAEIIKNILSRLMEKKTKQTDTPMIPPSRFLDFHMKNFNP